MSSWYDLPDDELRARLVHHGIDDLAAEVLVRRRDEEEVAQSLDELLDDA